MAEKVYFDYHEAEAGKNVLVFADESFDEFDLTTDKLIVSEDLTTSEVSGPSEKYDLATESFKLNELFSSRSDLSYSDSFNLTSEKTIFFNRQSLAPPYHYETWHIENPVVGTSIGRVLKTFFMGLIQNVSIHCKEKGISGKTKIDIKLNGTSIFSSDLTKPTLNYNDSSNSTSSNCIVNGIVGKDDELTLDIEEIATGVSGLTVILTIAIISTPLNVHSVTVVDNNNFSYTENTSILTGSSTQVKFKVVFTTSLFYIPTIQLINNTTYETITLELGELTTTSVMNDTVITELIDTSDLEGDYTLIIKDGISFSGTTHTPYRANFTFLPMSVYDFLEYNRYTNNPMINIIIDLSFLPFLSNYSYSLDGINWSEFTELSSPFTIDITNTEVGGSNTEGDKIIYLRFSNPHTPGYLVETITIGYYYSPISFSINAHGFLDKDSNKYYIDYNLPSTSIAVPPRLIEVRNSNENGSLLYKADIDNIVLSGLSASVTDIDTNTWKIIISEGYLLINTQESPVYISDQEILLNKPSPLKEFLYLVYYDLNDNSVKVSESYSTLISPGSTESPGVTSFITEDIVRAKASAITNGITLHGIVIHSNDQIHSQIYSFIEQQTIISFTVPDYVSILYMTITDKAGRVAFQTIDKHTKLCKFDLYVHNEYPEFDKVTALKNATIVNDPLDTVHIKLYPRGG